MCQSQEDTPPPAAAPDGGVTGRGAWEPGRLQGPDTGQPSDPRSHIWRPNPSPGLHAQPSAKHRPWNAAERDKPKTPAGRSRLATEEVAPGATRFPCCQEQQQVTAPAGTKSTCHLTVRRLGSRAEGAAGGREPHRHGAGACRLLRESSSAFYDEERRYFLKDAKSRQAEWPTGGRGPPSQALPRVGGWWTSGSRGAQPTPVRLPGGACPEETPPSTGGRWACQDTEGTAGW